MVDNLKTFIWDISKDSSETIAHHVIKTQFGDGYEQVVSLGINNSRKQWQCSKTDTKAVIDEIIAFLHATKGVMPFYFQPIKSEPKLKVRLDGGISRQFLGNDVWQVSFKLIQVF